MEYKISFLPDKADAVIGEDHSILDAAKKAGVLLLSPCDGGGSCGKCRVFVREGKAVGDKKDGLYLACRSFPLTDLVVEIPPESRLPLRQRYSVSEKMDFSELTGIDVSLAVDLGTTSISAYLVDSKTGGIVAYASTYNKQMGYGLDVLSRIDYARHHGVESLNRRIISSMNDLISELLAGKEHMRLGDVVCAGNPAMTFFLLDRDTSLIIDEPGSKAFRETYSEDAERLRLKAQGKIHTLPGVSGFIGGDVLADILASGIHENMNPSLLIDVGTNGEVVLGSSEFLTACSTSAGPAFEGGQIRSGVMASSGAIDHVRVEDKSLVYSTLGDELPIGICGSGLIDLLACLFSLGVVDYQGRFNKDKMGDVRDGEHGLEYVLVAGEDTGNGKDIVFSEQEVHSFIRSKAALFAGVMSLLKVGVSFDELEKVYVAGSFGQYLNVENAITIGMLPDIERERFEFIGNGSLRGSYLALIDPEKRSLASKLASEIAYVDLSRDEAFNDEYLAALYLPHMNDKLFPSIER